MCIFLMLKANKVTYMRVISGSARGLRLDCPDGIDTRPTLDRVKEAMFSMLAPYIPMSDVLDLFSGSGALGIEALSRGAKSSFFVDNRSDAVKCIKNNIESAKLGDRAEVYFGDAYDFLKKQSESFDIIFIDPPYSKNLYKPITEEIYKNKILKSDGLIVLEWDFANSEPQFCEHFVVEKRKKYGRVGITVLKEGNV